MSDANKNALLLANAAMAAGDTEGFLAFCTDDTEWTFIGEQTLRGKDAVRKYLAGAYGKPPKFDVTDMVAENDLVTAIGNITITSPDITEKSFWYCDTWRFRGARMAQLRAFVVEKR